MNSPAYKRDTFLSELRHYVIEVVFFDGKAKWMTLKIDQLPASYINEEKEEKTFHKKNPTSITAWDVRKKKWEMFDISEVQYLQIKDGF